MSRFQPQLPQRVPPPRTAGPPTGRPATVPVRGDDAPFTLTSDAFALQAHLDRLTGQFDGLKRQLRQAQKLATLGTSAAMIAHEFNNLFTPVVAYAQHALDTGDEALAKKALAKTVERCAVMRNMADRLIGLAKQSDSVIKSVNVLAVVQGAIECLCRDPARDNIAVNLQIDPQLAVRANENGLMQVLLNLVINARQAMLGRRGRLTVDAAARDGGVELSVRDTGCGIPAENLDRIFEPFFSTKQNAEKPDARGLGLGLSICREIVEEYGGTIDVASEVNVGTTFTLHLPQAD